VATHTLDARNLLCPMPVIRVQDAVALLQAGDVLEVVASDPGVLHDIPAWCRLNGHRVVSSERNGREIHLRLRVGGAAAEHPQG
jgi:TusA-related sulfurtransferase